MSVVSMTGFGRGEVLTENLKIVVELSSINRKQFDCQFSMPRSLGVLEARLVNLLRESIGRGSIKVAVDLKPIFAGTNIIDAARARQYVTELRKVAKSLKMSDSLSAGDLLRIPEITGGRTTDLDPQLLWEPLSRATKEALARLNAMRINEGRLLERDIHKRLTTLKRLVSVISKRAPKVLAEYRVVLEKRLKDLGYSFEEDRPLFIRELTFFADRCDINEELTRLGSHFKQAEDFLNDDKPCGRSLDFLCQEFLREINTIGSKANDATITAQVVNFKTALEAMREQIQNVE